MAHGEEARSDPRRFSAAWLLERYHALFGLLPNSTAWHPLHSVLRGVVAALGRTNRDGNALVISSGGLLTAPLSRVFKGRTLSLSTGMALARLYQESPVVPAAFDACMMDLAPEDIARLPELIAAVRPSLTREARLVVFSYLGDAGPEAWMDHVSAASESRAAVSFTGSTAGAIAADMFLRSAARFDLGSTRGRLSFMPMMAVAAPFARLATATERLSDRPPARCTSVTLEITP
jgi:hypothetical protein